MKGHTVTMTVARREVLDVFRDGRFRWAVGLLLCLLVASVVAGMHRAREIRSLRDRAQREERERWLNKGKMLAHPAMHFGFYVYQPYLELSAIDDGIEPYAGAYKLLEAHEQKLFQDRPAADDVPTRRLTDLTPTLCLQVLVPLLIIAMGHATYVGEREAGTWGLVLSSGVRPRDLFLGKALGAAVPLLLVLVPTSVLSAVAMLASSSTRSDLLIRLVVLLIGYLLYFAGYFFFTLAVSMRAASSRQALLLLFTFWFVTTLMVPLIAADIGSTLYPAPTSLQYAADILKAKAAQHYPTASEVEEKLLATYHVKSVDQLPVDPQGIHLLWQQAIDDPIYDGALAHLYGIYRKQEHLVQVAGVLAPPLAIQSISMTLAGTDTESHIRFAEYAARYRRKMETTLNEDAAYNLTPGPRDRTLWEKIPDFAYQPLSSKSEIRRCAFSMVFLAGWAFGALLVLNWSASRLGA